MLVRHKRRKTIWRIFLFLRELNLSLLHIYHPQRLNLHSDFKNFHGRPETNNVAKVMSNPSNFRFTPPLYPQFTTKEPNMIHFMEETHLNKKTPTISDLKTKQILDGVKRKLELTNSQRQAEGDDSVQSNSYTEEEINTLMLETVATTVAAAATAGPQLILPSFSSNHLPPASDTTSLTDTMTRISCLCLCSTTTYTTTTIIIITTTTSTAM